MKPTGRSFDRLAQCYRALEFLAFGNDLERARFSLLPLLRDSRRILILGEGDGRCLEKLIAIVPQAEIVCLDNSAAMLASAQHRLGDRAKHVTFQHADLLTTNLPTKHYDAVITCFFLDCFTTEQATAIIARVSRSLRPEARWLWADFVLPPRGILRWRAKIWLSVLYTFFRWQTGLQTRKLPPSESLIRSAGFRVHRQGEWQGKLLRNALFVRQKQSE